MERQIREFDIKASLIGLIIMGFSVTGGIAIMQYFWGNAEDTPYIFLILLINVPFWGSLWLTNKAIDNYKKFLELNKRQKD